MALLLATLLLTRLSAPIVVDGVMNDEAWRTIEPLPVTMYLPVFRGQPTQRAEIRVAYDAEYFYVGGWFYDTDPKGIRINSLYRDRWKADDALAIYIDGFNDNRNSKWFGVTAAGMRFDELVSDDGGTLNDNWDGFWDAKTTITHEGWFVEVRIPFSTIGFQADAEGRATMGLTLTRLVSRLGERVTFPAIDPKFTFRRPSIAQDVTLQGVASPTPFYLTRFPLFFPERRRFFQESAGLFDFVTAGGGRLFHSRRIGLTRISRDRVGPVRRLGAVGCEGGRRRMGRAEVVPRERDHAVHDRRHRPRSARHLRLRPSAGRVHDALGRQAADRRRRPRGHLLRRPAPAGDPLTHVERLEAPGAGRRLLADAAALPRPRRAGEHPSPSFRIRTALDVRASANAVIQYNSTTDRVDLNVRLRYNVREGTDLWVVYNEGLDTDRMPTRFDLPADPLSLSRAVIVSTRTPCGSDWF